MFYAIPNMRASTAFEVPAPWDLKTKTPPDYTKPKEDVVAWGQRFETEHAYISAFEGTSAGVRVTQDGNPAYQMHGLIVDYDAPLPANPVEHIKTRRQCEYMPTHLVTTSSGQGRLVWQFEKPLLWANKTHHAAFMKLLLKNLKLNRWLGGLDTQALAQWWTYYELGKQWDVVDESARIPSSILTLWFFQTAEGVKFDDSKKITYNIPDEDLASEVEARYPGRWKGPFTKGSRGVRFWDPQADNETAAVVTADGMLCYTGTQAFVPWRQLFGAAFVEKYEADAVSDIIENAVYDGQKFYMRTNPDKHEWVEFAKPDFTQELRVRGKNSARTKGSTASEIDIIENRIKRDNRIKAALPFLFFPTGVIRYEGMRFLNVSTLAPVQPAAPEVGISPDFADGRRTFPMIHGVLRSMFLVSSGDTGVAQLNHLLAWMKYAYENALAHTPKPGHTIIIAGPQGKGKTFLSWHIISGLMGGRADAAAHLVDGDRWTARIVEKPIMTVDDSSALRDEVSRREFTNRIKKYTANAEILCDQKFEKTGGVPWLGRIVVTCNLDAESLMILPDMQTSTADKICLFKASDAKIDFKSREENEAAVKRELPSFGRFLLEWEYPPETRGEDSRFGITAFHHPDLYDEARAHGIGLLLEMTHGFLEEYFELHPEKDYWEGTALNLCADLSAKYPQQAKEIKHRGMNVQLGKAASAGYRVVKLQSEESLTIWRLYRNMFHRTKPGETLQP